MLTVNSLDQIKHPCFHNSAHGQVARVHLPVAPNCQLSCGYCQRGLSQQSNLPGKTNTILKPSETVAYLKPKLKLFPTAVIGIAGPGDPLATEDALKALRLIQKAFPENKRCLCTNGLYLAEKLPQLIETGIHYLTVTVNAVKPATACQFYQKVVYKGKILTGLDASQIIIKKQWEGLKKATKAGLVVKINTVFVPEINASELVVIAKKAAQIGVKVMNIIPLIPGAKMQNLRPPTKAELEGVRQECSRFLPQFTHCQHCRADAWGRLR